MRVRSIRHATSTGRIGTTAVVGVTARRVLLPAEAGRDRRDARQRGLPVSPLWASAFQQGEADYLIHRVDDYCSSFIDT